MDETTAATSPLADNIVSINFDLRAVIRVALVWAAEYAMLSLIEDAPEVVKVATLLCAVAALVVMQFEGWLRGVWKKSFRFALLAVALVYMGFIGYAVKHTFGLITIRNGLESRYVAGRQMQQRSMITTTGAAMDTTLVGRFSHDVDAWEAETDRWLLDNLSPAAAERFLDYSNQPAGVMWNENGQTTPLYSETVNRLTRDNRNLAVIMETHSYGP